MLFSNPPKQRGIFLFTSTITFLEVSQTCLLYTSGTDVIRIVGVEKLHKTEYSIIPDQIEAGTFMFAAAATKGDVTVKNVIPKHLEATTAKLIEIGCEVEEFDDAVRVVSSKLSLIHI